MLQLAKSQQKTSHSLVIDEDKFDIDCEQPQEVDYNAPEEPYDYTFTTQDNDATKMYLVDIGFRPLLSKDEEFYYAKKHKKVTYNLKIL